MRLASLEDDGWELESGEQLHVASPATFSIPPRADRDAVGIGEIVKLQFLIDTVGAEGDVIVQTELMWVVVTEVFSDGYRGTLDNEPASLTTLTSGALVDFHAEHVIDIAPPG